MWRGRGFKERGDLLTFSPEKGKGGGGGELIGERELF